MDYELYAKFSDKNNAYSAINKIQQSIPFSIATVESSGTDKSHNLFKKTQTPPYYSSVFMSEKLPSIIDHDNYNVYLVGNKDMCDKAADNLKKLGATDVSISIYG